MKTNTDLLEWTLAFRTPQLHIFGEKKATRSSINAIWQACQEAREIGNSILVANYRIWKPCDWERGPPQYINPDMDTVWLDRSNWVPDHSAFYPVEHNVSLKRLVLDLDFWEDPTEASGYSGMGSTFVLQSFKNVQELLLVVDRPSELGNPSNILFIEPSERPYDH